jgi:hypothetical protein
MPNRISAAGRMLPPQPESPVRPAGDQNRMNMSESAALAECRSGKSAPDDLQRGIYFFLSRLASVRRRNAFSLMKPSASFWS